MGSLSAVYPSCCLELVVSLEKCKVERNLRAFLSAEVESDEPRHSAAEWHRSASVLMESTQLLAVGGAADADAIADAIFRRSLRATADECNPRFLEQLNSPCRTHRAHVKWLRKQGKKGKRTLRDIHCTRKTSDKREAAVDMDIWITSVNRTERSNCA